MYLYLRQDESTLNTVSGRESKMNMKERYNNKRSFRRIKSGTNAFLTFSVCAQYRSDSDHTMDETI